MALKAFSGFEKTFHYNVLGTFEAIQGGHMFILWPSSGEWCWS